MKDTSKVMTLLNHSGRGTAPGLARDVPLLYHSGSGTAPGDGVWDAPKAPHARSLVQSHDRSGH